MNESELANRLHELPLLRSFSEDAKTRFADVFRRASKMAAYAGGEQLIKQRALGGQDGYVLLDGEVEVDRDGSAPVVLSAPALLGEMLQFNPRAQRTATVRAHGAATALKFPWQDFYATAKQFLSESEQDLLMEAIERSVWERFGSGTIIDLSLFNGLSDRLKLRACLVLQWIVQHQSLVDGARLFAQGDACGATGFVVVQGSIRLVETNYPPRMVEAPDILGVMPRFDSNLQWSATATAQGDAQLMRFSWQDFMAMLQRRLTPEESALFTQAIDDNAPAHFVH